MLFVSWNVNGLRACLNKGFADFFLSVNADIFAIQETKLQKHQLDLKFDGYFSYYNDAIKKGYSGTAIYTKKEPLNVTYGLGIDEHDQEGRVITLEYENFYFITVYTPNSKRGLERLDYRQVWEDAFREYVCQLKQNKAVVICGDLNLAHQEIDLKNDKTNHKNAGFTGTRLGYAVVPKDIKSNGVTLHSLWARRHGTKYNGAPYIIQRAGEAVYSEAGKAQLKQQVAYYMNNAKVILEGLKKAGYEVYGGVNAPYIWLKTPNQMTSWEFFDYLLENANVVGTPGSGFGPSGEGYFRLTAFGNYENTVEAVERIIKL